jgi:hypothetical protein
VGCEPTEFTRRMRELLIIYVVYCICASAALVGSTLLDKGRGLAEQQSQRRIKYVPISDFLLLRWAAHDPNFVIFDVPGDRGTPERDEFESYWLPTAINDLPNLVKWVPHASRVVLCCRDATKQLDGQTETTLARLGIGTVYFLDDRRLLQGYPEITANMGSDNIGTKSKAVE